MPIERAVIWGVFMIGLIAVGIYFAPLIANGIDGVYKGFGFLGYVGVFGSIMAIIGVAVYALKS